MQHRRPMVEVRLHKAQLGQRGQTGRNTMCSRHTCTPTTPPHLRCSGGRPAHRQHLSKRVTLRGPRALLRRRARHAPAKAERTSSARPAYLTPTPARNARVAPPPGQRAGACPGGTTASPATQGDTSKRGTAARPAHSTSHLAQAKAHRVSPPTRPRADVVCHRRRSAPA